MTTRRSAQFARHTTIVLAGAASLSLTVIAGAYIVHEMAGAQRSDRELAAPVVPFPAERAARGRTFADPVLTSGNFELPTLITGQPATGPNYPESQGDSTVARPPASLGGNLRLGDAYVGARLTETGTETVSVTVDTNAFAVLTGFQLSHPGQDRNDTGVTTVRTDLDMRSGEVRVVFSDPALGEHDLRVHGYPTVVVSPETTHSDRGRLMPTGVGTTTAGATHPAEPVAQPSRETNRRIAV